MHLTQHQLDRFLLLIEGVTAFAIALLRAIRSRSSSSKPTLRDIDDALTLGEFTNDELEEATDMLWSSPRLIDEFVEMNPFALNKDDLAEVARWKSALAGVFVLVGFEEGRAILMRGDDLFAMSGLECEPYVDLPQPPHAVMATLVPFEDTIVSATECVALPIGVLPVLGAQPAEEVVCEQAAAARENGVVRNADDFVARSLLARERCDQSILEDFEQRKERGKRMTGESQFPGFHRGALSGVAPSKRAAAITAHYREEGEAVIVLALDDRGSACADPLLRDAVHCAAVMGDFFGVVPIEDVYAQFKSWFGHNLDLLDFASALWAAIDDGCESYGIWEDPEGEVSGAFVVAAQIGLVLRKRGVLPPATPFEELIPPLVDENGNECMRVFTPTYINALLAKRDEIDDLIDGFIKRLLVLHARLPAAPLPAELAEQNVLEWLVDQPTMRAIRSYLDLHVPDGIDDYCYADSILMMVLLDISYGLALPSQDSDSAIPFARTMSAICDDMRSDLEYLIVSAHNAAPRWNNNGWSPCAATELILGVELPPDLSGAQSEPLQMVPPAW